ncbi:MAG: hypothetical protein LBK02_05285, partial [Treponema sp.]|nr:hypothetical protein [Treponema sp.]
RIGSAYSAAGGICANDAAGNRRQVAKLFVGEQKTTRHDLRTITLSCLIVWSIVFFVMEPSWQKRKRHK